jgi:hypothetical protein
MIAPAFLIGGGPSARDLDTARLNGFRIGVNDAAFHKPVDVFFSNDHNYARDVRSKIEASGMHCHLCMRHANMDEFRKWNKTTLWRRIDQPDPSRRAFELSTGPHGTPGCSGYAAINLALQLGFRDIVLFGYDFHENYTYFFDDEPFPRIRIPEVIASFDAVALHYARMGANVINANPNSAISGFKRVTHEEAIRWARQPR